MFIIYLFGFAMLAVTGGSLKFFSDHLPS